MLLRDIYISYNVFLKSNLAYTYEKYNCKYENFHILKRQKIVFVITGNLFNLSPIS